MVVTLESTEMAMAKLTPQDRKDLDKFTKFLIYKSVQIIVQSRLGDKVKTLSKPFSSGSDWFNLAIKDIPEVLSETKKALSSQLINTTQSLCVEISLKTAEGETMVLEMWTLGMTEQCDSSVKVSYMVYNCMGILLKSLFCVSRVTPAYRLSRSQGPDNYVICYRIYLGETTVNHLGSGYETLKVGTVPTPVGTIVLSVAYRTKMLISPQHSCRDLSIELKDDHFKQDSPKKSSQPKPCLFTYHNNNRSGDEIESEYCATSFSNSPPDSVFICPNCNPNKSHCRTNHNCACTCSRQHHDDNKLDNAAEMVPERQISFSQIQKMGAFAPAKTQEKVADQEDVPFANLYRFQQQPNDLSPSKRSQSSKKSDSDVEMAENGGMSESNSSSHCSAPDDFVMVELKTPFAASDTRTDLGKFYRECQVAPNLVMFENEPTVTDTMDQIADQIVTFETNRIDFDAFMDSLHFSDD